MDGITLSEEEFHRVTGNLSESVKPPDPVIVSLTPTTMACDWYPRADERLIRFANAVFIEGMKRGEKRLAGKIRLLLPPETNSP